MFTPGIRGRGRLGLVLPGEEFKSVSPWQHNDVLYDWATIVGNRLVTNTPDYKISFMYIEFENVASPSNPVSLPIVYRGGGQAYYRSLSSSPNNDYLRVPIISGVLTSTDIDNFPGGNLLTFFAQTQGLTGVNGKPFSNAANSKVYGGALIAAPDPDDATQDLIFARLYYAAVDQIIKPATSAQVGMQWEENLG